MAEDWSDPFVVCQKTESPPAASGSSNSVPPIDVLYGVEEMPLTAITSVPGSPKKPPAGAHAVDDESPLATKTLMPWAAACCHRLLQKAFPSGPRFCSQLVKLTLTICARFCSTI